jgi:hypothetical protein
MSPFVPSYEYLYRTEQLGGNPVNDKRVDFTYDAAGRMASMNRYTSLDTSKLAVTTHYTYDERGRVRP